MQLQNQTKLPLNGECLQSGVIYQAEVTSENRKETYIGLTATEFKKRYSNHKTSFNDEKKKSATELSKHIWDLKNAKKDFSIKWRIITKANPYNPATKRCNLCIAEKFFILLKPDLCTLNKRNEIMTKCRHQNNHLLSAVT